MLYSIFILGYSSTVTADSSSIFTAGYSVAMVADICVVCWSQLITYTNGAFVISASYEGTYRDGNQTNYYSH